MQKSAWTVGLLISGDVQGTYLAIRRLLQFVLNLSNHIRYYYYYYYYYTKLVYKNSSNIRTNKDQLFTKTKLITVHQKANVILEIPYLHILQRQFSQFHCFMHDLKEQTEVAVLLSLGREFHNMLPRKDKLSLP